MKNTQKLKTLSLVAVTFFLVSGGPHGLEEAIKKSGYGLAILALVLVPFLWALPTCFMVAELGSALPAEGGFYVWTRRALGKFWGFGQAWLALAASVFDMGLYPNMFWDYCKYALQALGYLDPTAEVEQYRLLACACVVVPAVLLNLRGAKAVGDTSKISALLLLSPFVVLIGLVVFHHQPIIQEVAVPPPISAQGLLGGVLVAMWNYMGWDNASTIGNEVENPRRTYPLAMIITVTLVALIYVAPVAAMAASGVSYDRWDNGYWVVMGGKYGGAILAAALAAAGMVSAFHMFQNLTMSYTRLPVALAKNGWLPKSFGYHNRFGAPFVAILACALLWSFSLMLKFDKLLTLDVMLYGGSLLIEFAALIALRIKEPHLLRPFRIPGGIPTLVVLALLPASLIGCALIYSGSQQVFGINALHFGLAVVGLGVIVFFVRRRHYRESDETAGT